MSALWRRPVLLISAPSSQLIFIRRKLSGLRRLQVMTLPLFSGFLSFFLVYRVECFLIPKVTYNDILFSLYNFWSDPLLDSKGKQFQCKHKGLIKRSHQKPLKDWKNMLREAETVCFGWTIVYKDDANVSRYFTLEFSPKVLFKFSRQVMHWTGVSDSQISAIYHVWTKVLKEEFIQLSFWEHQTKR